MKKLLKIGMFLVIGAVLLVAGAAGYFYYLLSQDQPQILTDAIVDYQPPQIRLDNNKFSLLVFSKTNHYRHKGAIERGNLFFEQTADKNGWDIVVTENAAIHNAEQLAQFDVIIWNNATDPALTNEQQQAMKQFITEGGGFIAIHAAGDDSHTGWAWYQTEVIRTPYSGHTIWPQFQLATMLLDRAEHPVMKALPTSWEHDEEWYSFEHSPRETGVDILATVDEQTYFPGYWINGQDLAMGDDHPVIWAHQLVGGRVVYTALGHQAKTFELPWYQQLLERAVIWAGGKLEVSEGGLGE